MMKCIYCAASGSERARYRMHIDGREEWLCQSCEKMQRPASRAADRRQMLESLLASKKKLLKLLQSQAESRRY